MWLTEYSEQMHNLRTRIKRRKEALRKTHLQESSSSTSSSKNSASSVEADWQFVNFNPCMYGPRKSLESSDLLGTSPGSTTSIFSSNPNIAETGTSPSSASTGSTLTSQNATAISEDFYEFPTSTNLKQIVTSGGAANAGHGISRETEGLVGRDSGLQQKRNPRSSIASMFDLLPNQIQVQGQNQHNHHLQQQQVLRRKPTDSLAEDGANPSNNARARPLSGLGLMSVPSGSTDSVVVTISKSNSILSTSSSSSSVSTSGYSSNPVSRSSSRCTPVSQPQSKFYIPSPSSSSSPSSRPPLPLPRDALVGLIGGRPHSWDADSGTGTLVIDGRDIVYGKKTRFHHHHSQHHHSPPPPTHHNLSAVVGVSDKRKRNLFYEQGSRKVPANQAKGKNASPRIPHPPPMPSYSLEETVAVGACVPVPPGFPHHRGKPRQRASMPPAFTAGFSAVGSLCLSVINNHSDRPLTGSGSSASNLKGDRRPDTLSEERLENDGHGGENEEMDRVRQEPKRTSNAVGRSESCKEPQRKQPRERRKHSDPNLTSKSSDVDLDNQRHLSDANNSGSSSNSSLSARSLDSPNTSSIELVAQSVSSSSLRGRDSETPEHSTVRHPEVITDYKTHSGWDGDSDIEIEQDPPDWSKDVPEETLSGLGRLEKKRQDVLNELFHTERLFVRKLKIMDRLFFRPMKTLPALSSDLIVHLLFPNLEDVLGTHEQFNADLKKKRTEQPVVGDIGPVLLETFDGERGEQLKQAASAFCARQQIGLELLREKRKRDMKFHAFLTEAESDPVCRRLGIKDMIPTVMQRLTKYPLLFESLCNCTAADSTEYKNLQRALELSKEILCSVNLAKKEAEDEERLQEIQRKLDKSFFEKGVERTDHAFNDLRNFDFTRHKLMYDGSLMWRVNKAKGDRLKSEHQEVLLVLLEDMIVLLLKSDDRYVLKSHNIGSRKEDRMPAKPTIKLNTLHATGVAADKRAFYLLSKTSPIPYMFELVCSTAEERTIWLQHITRAADDYKSRQDQSRRSEVHPVSNIPPSVTESEDRSKESGEATETNGQDTSDQTTTDSSGTQQDAVAGTSLQKDSSPAPDNSASGGTASPPPSPEKGVAGDGKLSVGASGGQSESPSPARCNQQEFLRVTESSPLIDPSEVVVETTEVHFAKLIISPYEELKRADSKIQMAFEEKLKLISKMCHIPVEAGEKGESSSSSASSEASELSKPKDAKELVVACIHQVDQLGRLIATQKLTSENIQVQKEQLNIHKVLNTLLAQLLNEVHRKDEDLELRRQELHRIREQNHGYQERLQAKAKAEQTLVSPARSPTHSRPNSFVSLSSSSDHHDFAHEDEAEVVAKAPLKQQLSAPVASSSSNTSPPTLLNPGDAGSACDTVAAETRQGESGKPASDSHRSRHSHPASELAPEEFADALEDLVTTDWDSAIETNRESTETEVVAPTKNEKCQQQQAEESGSQGVGNTVPHNQSSEERTTSSSNNVPDNRNGEVPDTESVLSSNSAAASETTNILPSDGNLTNGHPLQEVAPSSSESISSGGDNNNTKEEVTNGKTGSNKAETTTTVHEGTPASSVES